MRKPIVAGNWKMNKEYTEAKNLHQEILKNLNGEDERVEIFIAPPSIYLSDLAQDSDERVGISAQNVSEHKEEGAFTGEISARMLKSAGVKYAILGHSERRQYHGEDDELISKKIRACIDADIAPVYCCGENLDEREAGNHVEVVKQQVMKALKSFKRNELVRLIVAYEPVWAIGTGKTASAEQAQEMHSEIRKILADLYDISFADECRILYGGSCKPSNARSIFEQTDVDGGLIGGASLNAEDFVAIISAAAE